MIVDAILHADKPEIEALLHEIDLCWHEIAQCSKRQCSA